MLILALETATNQVSCAVSSDGALLAEIRVACRQRHAEQLTPAVRQVCELAGVRLTAIGAVAVGVGPGLFTGLRVGVATAQALAFALGVQVAPVSSLDALALPFAAAGVGAASVVAAIDARRSELFWALYRDNARHADPVVGTPAALCALLRAEERPTLVVGDGARRYGDELSQVRGVTVAGAGVANPCASAVAELAWPAVLAGDLVAPALVAPLYLRPPDAAAHWVERDRVVGG